MAKEELVEMEGVVSEVLPKSAAAYGIDFPALCLRIAELSLAARSK